MENVVERVCEHVTPNHISIFTASSLSELPGTIHIIDHVEAIKDVFEGCQTFAEYLQIGLSKLRMIYDKYHIPIPNINVERFEYVREKVLSSEYHEIRASQVYAYKKKILEELARLFDHKIVIRDKSITLVNILLANFNAHYISQTQSILLSLDQIQKEDFERLLIHELTHLFTTDVWFCQNLSPIKKRYYDEGLVSAVSQKLSHSTIAEALYMNEDDFATYIANRNQLRTWFEDYIGGNICSYFDGKYHQYFQEKEVLNPFVANGHQYQRYGYVLSVLETQELIEKGVYYDRIFCESIS